MFFKELPDRISRNDTAWREWNDKNEPEREIVPDNYEERIKAEHHIGSFIHMCLVRSFREDRTLLAGTNFISSVLGQKFTAPVTDLIEEIFEESRKNVPVVYLLSAGADPTNSIDEFAKKKKQFPTGKVSMGEEMEGPALELIKAGFVTGKWVVLNNCHLSLEFMGQLEEILNPKNAEVHNDFRLWITCEPHKEFPLGLLQMAIKVTTQPPKGLQAGLYRTFTTLITPDYLEKVEPLDHWRSLLFAICFMHSIVQERRKYGPLGFCIPYEFNSSDMEASLCYIEKHLTDCMAEKVSY
jgi:dynein heavy chain